MCASLKTFGIYTYDELVTGVMNDKKLVNLYSDLDHRYSFPFTH